MKVELPQFKRCCCCVPLRYGLMVWGYVKLITTVLFGATLGLAVEVNPTTASVIVTGVIFLMLLVDIAFSIVFIVGAHTKNLKLFSVYYHYAIVVVVLACILFVLQISVSIYIVCTQYVHPFQFMALIAETAVNILSILLEFYMILLVRSEIIKLKNNVQFKFVNVKVDDSSIPEAEGEEKIKYDRLEPDDGKNNYNDCEV